MLSLLQDVMTAVRGRQRRFSYGVDLDMTKEWEKRVAQRMFVSRTEVAVANTVSVTCC